MALTANQLTVLDIIIKGPIGAGLTGLISVHGFRIQDARQEEDWLIVVSLAEGWVVASVHGKRELGTQRMPRLLLA